MEAGAGVLGQGWADGRLLMVGCPPIGHECCLAGHKWRGGAAAVEEQPPVSGATA